MDNIKASKNAQFGARSGPKNNVPTKTIRSNNHSLKDIQKLKNEYNLLQGLNIRGVRKIIEHEVLNHQHQFVIEHIDARSLKDYIREIPLSMSEKLDLMIRLVKVLEGVHQEGIIHKDITPANILVTPHQDVFLTNFGISSRFTLHQSNLGNPEKIEGTLQYISPEQTGRMNRSVDYRTDLYTLGATFYELLTKRTVFEENEAMALVHAHIAKAPKAPALVDKTIPILLSNIVLKLLEKNPENRYQSALGLRKDLEKYLSRKEKGDAIVDFELGQDDFSGKLQIPEKLYGREKEIEVLLEAFQRVKAGNVELILVTGYSGTGKSVLVSETHKSLTSTRGYFLEGKFDQFQQNIPFSAWIQAFQNFIDLLLTENEDTLNYWRKIILEAVGNNGGVLIEVIPSLELVIGRQPVVVKLGGQEAQNRFNYVIQNFVKAITTQEHPLIIFIDDLQWADMASLHLLKTLTTDHENTHLLCVGAYRDNEVSTQHPLRATLKEIEQDSKNTSEIKVENLSREALMDLLSDTLDLPQENEKLQALGEVVLSKTRGNAFFAHQFLKNLYEEALLRFDYEQKQWRWDILKITNANFTDNVVDFMAAKVAALPIATQKLLELASCIGNKFDEFTLKIIAEKESINTDLEIAIAEDLIYLLKNHQYKFAHDRIQQAAYSLIPEKEKQITHLKIGQLLQASLPEQEKEEHIFDIAYHFNLAQNIFSNQDRRDAILLNQKAAIRAKASASFEAMLSYIRKAKHLLPEHSWEANNLQTLEIYLLMGEAEISCSNYENSEKLHKTLLARPDIPKKYRIQAFLNLVTQHSMQTNYQEATNYTLKALEEVGIFPHLDNLDEETKQEKEQLDRIIQASPDSLTNLKNSKGALSEDEAFPIQLLANAIPLVFLTNRQLMTLLILKASRLSLQYGALPESGHAFSWYSFLLSNIYGEFSLGKAFGNKALEISDFYNESAHKAKAYDVFSNFVSPWVQHIQKTNQLNKIAYQHAIASGDVVFAGYNLVHQWFNPFYQGKKLTESQIQQKEVIAEVRQIRHGYALDILEGVELLLPILMSANYELLTVEEKYLSRYSNQNYYAYARYHILRAEIFFFLDDREEAKHSLTKAKEYADFCAGTISYFNYYFFQLLIFEQEDNDALLNQLKVWADNCPENFSHKYQLVQAEQARGRKESWFVVLELYDQAIQSAKINGFTQDVALINELTFKYLTGIDKTKIAVPYLIEAYDFYNKWGAAAKTAQMRNNYPTLLTSFASKNEHHLQSMLETGQANNSSEHPIKNLDLDTILKANATLSQQIHLKALIYEMLSLLSKNSGANKIAFLLKEEMHWVIQADQENEEDLIGDPILLEEYQNIPQQLITYVLRNKEFILLDDVSQNHQFAKDPYFGAENSRSVFIVPIKKHDKMLALLYLENNLSTGVFHQKRYELVNALVTQLAISMENTLLYESLENKVNLRTKELQESNDELQVMNEELRQTQEELQTQRDYVEEKNKVLQEFNSKINSSLKVAQTIQEAVLPYQAKLDRLLENYFVINRPKDVVSGDFYWLNEINGKVILVVADCTGHGIPGAFMTLIGANLLDKIIRIRQVTQPNEVLNQLHEEVQSVLKQRYTTNNKGMDAIVVSLEKQPGQTMIQFSGAKNNLYYYTDDLYELKGDRKSIGGIQDESIGFTNQQLVLPAGGMLYLGSDGLEDQNNHTRKKFGRKRLQTLLSYAATLPVDEQKTKIEEALKQYMQDAEQRDDILWMGIQI